MESPGSEGEGTNTGAPQRIEDLLDRLPVAWIAHDMQGVIRDWSREAERQLGYSQREAIGRPLPAMLTPPHEVDRRALRQSEVASGSPDGWTEERICRKDGTMCWVLHGMFPMHDAVNGRVVGSIHALLDISERKRLEDEAWDQIRRLEAANSALQALATRDGLTGLTNHRTFQERLALELRRALLTGTPLSLVLLDVDHFKRFNDTFGHPAGDDVLRGVARRLQDAVRPEDCVARYGGEEFAVILPGATVEDAMTVARRLGDAVRRPPWAHAPVTVSQGVAETDPTLINTADLIARADRALYASKGGGRDRATSWASLGEAPTTRIDLNEWLGRIDEARVDVSGTAVKRVLQQAILDHLQWKNRLRQMLSGAEAMAWGELTDHHHCRLGRWYDTAAERFRGSPGYLDLGEPHARLHGLAEEIVTALASGDRAGALSRLRELEDCSTRIVGCLERLIEGAADGSDATA